MNPIQIREIRWQQVAVAAMALAGLLHLGGAAGAWSSTPAYSLFLALAGLAELTWAAVFIGRPSLKAGVIGLILTLGLIALWGTGRLLPGFFSSGAAAGRGLELAGKVAEASGVLALAVFTFQTYAARSGRPAAWRGLVGLTVLSIALGALSYGAVRLSEPYLPGVAKAQSVTEEQLPQPEAAEVGASSTTFEIPWTAAEAVSADTLEERSGLRVTLIGVTALGGLIDFRFKVTDPEKVAAMLRDHDQMPRLVAEDSGAELRISDGMRHKLSMDKGRVYFVFYTNRQNAIQPGTPVSVVIGDMRLEHVIAQ